VTVSAGNFAIQVHRCMGRLLLAGALAGTLLAMGAPLAAEEVGGGHAVSGLAESASDAAQAKIRNQLISGRAERAVLDARITTLIDERDAFASALILLAAITGGYLVLRRARPAAPARGKAAPAAGRPAGAPKPPLPGKPAAREPSLAMAGGDKARR
jgi:hypothetical protein